MTTDAQLLFAQAVGLLLALVLVWMLARALVGIVERSPWHDDAPALRARQASAPALHHVDPDGDAVRVVDVRERRRQALHRLSRAQRRRRWRESWRQLQRANA